jgi:hypothetical protein
MCRSALGAAAVGCVNEADMIVKFETKEHEL